MSDDLLTALLRKQAQEMARELVKTAGAPIREIFSTIISDELRRMLVQEISPQRPLDLHANDPVRHNTGRRITHPSHCLIRRNRAFVGEVFSPGTKSHGIWQVLVPHLGDSEMTRAHLQSELGTLMPQYVNTNAITGVVSAALVRGALLSRLPGSAVGDAT